MVNKILPLAATKWTNWLTVCIKANLWGSVNWQNSIQRRERVRWTTGTRWHPLLSETFDVQDLLFNIVYTHTFHNQSSCSCTYTQTRTKRSLKNQPECAHSQGLNLKVPVKKSRSFLICQSLLSSLVKLWPCTAAVLALWSKDLSVSSRGAETVWARQPSGSRRGCLVILKNVNPEL